MSFLSPFTYHIFRTSHRPCGVRFLYENGIVQMSDRNLNCKTSRDAVAQLTLCPARASVALLLACRILDFFRKEGEFSQQRGDMQLVGGFSSLSFM